VWRVDHEPSSYLGFGLAIQQATVRVSTPDGRPLGRVSDALGCTGADSWLSETSRKEHDVTPDRKRKLRYYAALIDLKQDDYGSEASIAASLKAHSVLDELEPLTDADYGVINLAKREYLSERLAAGATS